MAQGLKHRVHVLSEYVQLSFTILFPRQLHLVAYEQVHQLYEEALMCMPVCNNDVQIRTSLVCGERLFFHGFYKSCLSYRSDTAELRY